MHARTVPSLLLVALLAIGGLAAAEGGTDTSSGGPGPSGDGGNQTAPPSNQTAPPSNGTSPPPPPPSCDQQPAGPQRDQCLKERYCANHPNDPRCPRKGPNATRPEPKARPVLEELQHISFTVDSARHILDYRVDGQAVLASLTLDTGAPGNHFVTERKGDLLVVGDADTRLRLHDNPVGLIEFKGQDGSALLGFPPGIVVDTGDDGHTARVHYPDGRDGLLVADNVTWDGGNVTLSGFFSFHIARDDGPFEDGGASVSDGALRDRLQQAVEARHLGAEVALADHPVNASRAVQVLAYDDMSVHVQLPEHAGAAPIAVQLSANLTEGRTVVLHVDPSLLGNVTPDRLDLRYYDDQPDGTRTEVVFAKADGLSDILDPTNDAGRPEYWVVSDADGLQILVSVPHWSTHTITLASLGEILQPNVMLGLTAGLAGTFVAGAALFWPRKPR